ncbi:transketolase [Alphaproteobacteria bacterium]|nr:transketolase [Alphaproteobacteria bacterium]
MKNYTNLANCIRFLSMEAVEKAKSGHPGMPMGMADIATILFHDFLVHNPKDPEWRLRDRFVLSNGHGSMLLYSLLYLSGYKKMTLKQIKNFRQLGSITAGHPEYEPDAGIEITTGPLGQGISNAVGMALALKKLASEKKLKRIPKVYVFCGDGCLMEGISQEAISFAGHLKLDNLVLVYDNNKISIDGSTELAFSDNTNLRFKSVNWNVLTGNGHNHQEIKNLFKKVQKTSKPSLINFKTIIGFGSPNKSAKASSHGSPLGINEIALTKKELKWNEKPFVIPAHLLKIWRDSANRNNKIYTQSKKISSNINGLKNFPKEIDKLFDGIVKEFKNFNTPQATRKSSEAVLHFINNKMPLFGGSADLTGSNNTKGKQMDTLNHKNYKGQYIHYGVREHGMASIMNGIAATRLYKTYSGTFLSFADYMKPSLRLAALMKIDPIQVFTHDSIGLGEDGPTHQPIEQINMLRLIPNSYVFRPCDMMETIACWKLALKISNAPSFICLSRQNLPQVSNKKLSFNNFKGAYVISQSSKINHITIIASGSEVSLAMETANFLKQQKIETKVVSMPGSSVFDEQQASFKKKLLQSKLEQVFVIEAGSSMYWNKYTQSENIFGIDEFGASAPAKDVFNKFGLTPKNISSKIMKRIKK